MSKHNAFDPDALTRLQRGLHMAADIHRNNMPTALKGAGETEALRERIRQSYAAKVRGLQLALEAVMLAQANIMEQDFMNGEPSKPDVTEDMAVRNLLKACSINLN